MMCVQFVMSLMAFAYVDVVIGAYAEYFLKLLLEGSESVVIHGFSVAMWKKPLHRFNSPWKNRSRFWKDSINFKIQKSSQIRKVNLLLSFLLYLSCLPESCHSYHNLQYSQSKISYHDY